ncbi:hypothetical protein FRC07_014641 [Ceratobasidium sp. 392]|nr:hypothetical protein FRC07_014641 [Ceratobasidium sp. 392]
MTTKSVAIAGASGLVGRRIVDNLLNVGGFEIRILVRGSSNLEDFEKRGTSMRTISYDDQSSIVKALAGVDVLVSAVAGSALESAQVALIQAAKEAGVKLFVPSEFGVYFADDSNPSPTVRAKKAVLRKAKEVGLPVAEIHSGGFPEVCFVPWVAYVLKHVPIKDLQDKRLNIQGDAVSANEIVALWEKKHDDKLEVEYHPVEELEARFNGNPDDVWAALAREWATGRGLLGRLDNGLYADWKPESVESTL